MEALAIAALLILPGGWIAFALRDGATSFGSRLSWAAALSPLVVAAELYLARRAAGSFPQTAWLVAALNAPAVILIWRRWRARIPAVYESSEWELWRGALVFLALAACTAVPWWMDPLFRTYSWRGLMQLDVIYSIAVAGVPWEAELAGQHLTAAWAPHVVWALEAAAAQRSPTLLYTLNNLLTLGACGLLAYELARTLGASKAGATASTVLLALGTNWPGLLFWTASSQPDDQRAAAWLGDPRHTPLLSDFVAFDAAPLGLALTLGVALSMAHLSRRPRRQEMVLLGAGVAGLAALYPDLFAAGAVLALAGVGALGWRARRDEGLVVPAIDAAGWTAVGLVAGYFILEGYGEGRAAPLAELSAAASLGGKAALAAATLGPLAAAAWLGLRTGASARPEAAAAAAAAAGMCALYLLLDMPGGNESALYAATGMLLTPLALAGLCDRFLGLRKRIGWVTWGGVATLAVVMTAYARHRIPSNPPERRELDERSFFVSLAAPYREGRWMAAVRVKCDTDTVLVVDRPDLHVSAFTARRLLIGSEAARVHAGCNLKSRFNLVELRGYDPAIVSRRLDLLDQIYRPERELTDAENGALLEKVAAEAGPELAFAFLPGDNRAFLEWMQRDRHVRVIYDDGVRTVVAP